MKKKIKNTVATLFAVVLIVGAGTADNANAFSTTTGKYFQHDAADVKIRTHGSHSATILGLAYNNEPWRGDCIASKGESIKFPWSPTLTTTWWMSARDLAPRSDVKGYTGFPYILPEGETKILLPTDFPALDPYDTCWFEDKTGPYLSDLDY